MSQLGIFQTPQKTIKDKFIFWFDGAARNNPGPAGAGIHIEKNNKPFYAHSYYLGKKTNNQAEYLAFVIGLYHVSHHIQSGDSLEIRADSQLIVRQITGIYKVKNAELKPLHKLALSILSNINYAIVHIPRELNTKADEKANEAIDNKTSVPETIKLFLNKNEITL